MMARGIHGYASERATDQLTGEEVKIKHYGSISGSSTLADGRELTRTQECTAAPDHYCPSFPIWLDENGSAYILA